MLAWDWLPRPTSKVESESAFFLFAEIARILQISKKLGNSVCENLWFFHFSNIFICCFREKFSITRYFRFNPIGMYTGNTMGLVDWVRVGTGRVASRDRVGVGLAQTILSMRHRITLLFVNWYI